MLTEEQKKELDAEIKALVDKQVEERLAKEITRKVPGDSEVKIVLSPEDKIMADKKGGFESMAHYISELIEEGKTHQPPEILKAWDNTVRVKDMEEGSLSAGGYLVPEQFSANILEKSLEDSIVRPRATIQPMMSNRIVIPADVDAAHQTNYFGGITIYRPGEAGSKTASSPTYERISLTLHKVTGLCHISDELLEDSAIAVEANVSRKFAQAIAFTQDDDFLNGNGSNLPLGVLNASNPALISTTRSSTSHIIAEDIRNMWARMYPAGQSKAVWIANNDVFPELFGMAIAVGTGGVPVWLPAGGVSGSPYQSLMGRPLILTEKCQTLGTAGDIALIDFSQYIIGERGGLQVATSIHFKFDYDQQSFRFVLRYDGQPTWTSTLHGLYSATTLSPFIVVAA